MQNTQSPQCAEDLGEGVSHARSSTQIDEKVETWRASWAAWFETQGNLPLILHDTTFTRRGEKVTPVYTATGVAHVSKYRFLILYS